MDTMSCCSMDLDNKCKFCPKTFPSCSLLLEHVFGGHPPITMTTNKYHCMICDSVFDDEVCLRTHFATHTLEEFSTLAKLTYPPVALTYYYCVVCESYFKGEDELKIHYASHSLEKNERLDMTSQRSSLNKPTQPRGSYCKICGKKFRSLETLKKHMSSHALNLEFCCHVCGQTYNKMCELKGHLLLHTPHELATIEFHMRSLPNTLNRVISDTKNLLVDTKVNDIYYCYLCATLVLEDMESHFGKVHRRVKDLIYCCHMCGEFFCKKQHLATHFIQNQPRKYPFSEPVCKQEDNKLLNMQVVKLQVDKRKSKMVTEFLPSYENIDVHEKFVTSEALKDVNEIKFCEANDTDAIVGETVNDFTDEIYLETRENNTHDEIDDSSEIAVDIKTRSRRTAKKKRDSSSDEYVPSDQEERRKRLKNIPNQDLSSCSDEELQTTCSICDQAFPTPNTLIEHELSCGLAYFTDPDPLKRYKVNLGYCYRCPRVFTLEGLRRHMHFHNTRDFTCYICHENLGGMAKLRRHVKVHRQCDCGDSTCFKCMTSKPILKCSICNNGKIYSTKKTFLDHANTHKEGYVNSYICEICGKEIYGKFHQGNSHMMTHFDCECGICKTCVKLKAFQCPVCQRQLSGKGQLERHTVIHTGIRDYVCDLCGDAFNQRGHLKYHLKTHERQEQKMEEEPKSSYNEDLVQDNE